MSAKHLLVTAAALSLLACGGAKPKTSPSLYDSLRAEVLSVAEAPQLSLRYNPAPCDCPAFELRLPKRWIRASWSDWSGDAWSALRGELSGLSPAQLPRLLHVKGSVAPSSLRRSPRGWFSVTVRVDSVTPPHDKAE